MFKSKIRKKYTPVNPNFTTQKVGCKWVYITRTCWHDVTARKKFKLSDVINYETARTTT